VRFVFPVLTILNFLLPAAPTGAAGFSFQPETLHTLSQERYWKLLLHYRKGYFKEESEIDGDVFFLSPKGKTDPEAELIADLKAFTEETDQKVGPMKLHPQCAFPERFRYLNEKLTLEIKGRDCPEFEKWKSTFNAQSVTLVYAAPYFGSPASMFGHSFLRVDSAPRPGHQEKNDLLDYGISFEADTGPNPGPDYVFKGLIGSYPGRFLQQPYYFKINNYVNMESRDLWEYKLAINREQLGRMLNHIWELGSTHSRYYFFNRNCSYQLLSLLEVANPAWHLRERFGPMAVPADTIRALVELGAVSSEHLRPSVTRTLGSRLKKMDRQEQEAFFHFRRDLKELTGKESLRTLDALLEWDKYHALDESKLVYDPSHAVDQRLLVTRARVASNDFYGQTTDGTAEAFLDENERPAPLEAGHKSTKISLGAGGEDGRFLSSFLFRPVFHDLLDPDEGYLENSSLVFARTRASLIVDNDVKKFRLDEFTAAEVINLAPISRLRTPLSWQIGGGLFHPEDVGCLDCLGGQITGGAGFSFQVSDKNPGVIFYTLLKPQVQLSNSFEKAYLKDYRFGGSIEAGALAKFSSHLKTRVFLEPEWFISFSSDLKKWTHTGTELSYSFLPFEARLQSEFFSMENSVFSRITGALGWYY